MDVTICIPLKESIDRNNAPQEIAQEIVNELNVLKWVLGQPLA